MLYPIFYLFSLVHPEGIEDSPRDAHQDDQQGSVYGDLYVEEFHEHLDPHEDQHDGDTLLQMAELVDGPAEEEEERTEAQHGEDIRGIDDEFVLGDPEDGRNAVDGEDDIGGSQKDHDHEKRCVEAFTI